MSKTPPPGPAVSARVTVHREGAEPERRDDLLAAEEPLEIRVLFDHGERRERRSIAVTMRTPGHDRELAAGFLWSEGAVARTADIQSVAPCWGEDNVVNVELAPGAAFDPERFTRNVYTTSSCGVCGKTSLDLVETRHPPLPSGKVRVSPARLRAMPERLLGEQALFQRTGGLHATALFGADGAMRLVREDVGRHNALDKVVGYLALEHRLPAEDGILLVSGRAGFELVQKAAAAGIPVLAAVGAPSSLAVDLALRMNVTLVGFLRNGRFNVYAGEERISR